MAPGGGLLVTLDGPSGVGKTTVSGLIRDRLAAAGVPVMLTATPSSSSLGELARHGTHQFYGAALTCLVAADRYHHDQTTVRDALERGSIIVCDRYVPSSLVLDLLDGVERDHVWSIYRSITVPDLAFILLGDPTLCATRARSRGRYSRFHTDNDDANRREVTIYKEAISFLRSTGYPVYEHDIGSAAADQVADVLTNLILEARDDRS
ncbi:MAG: dTMP kinase [Pseudonocardiaceae bacterium]